MEKLCHGIFVQITVMAEINIPAAPGGQGGRKRKVLSARVDLTPMVDLGFLLITFFIFSSKMSESKAMILVMPKDSPDSSMVGNTVFYYHGELTAAMKTEAWGITNYSVNDGIGEVIREKRRAMEKNKKDSGKDLFLMIKPADASGFGDVVDILDEVKINDLKHYALMDISGAEKDLVTAKKFEKKRQ